MGLLEEQVDEDHNGERAKLEDTRGIVYKLLEHRLKIPNVREIRIEFQRLHRFGKPKNGTSRPIIARFLRYGDKELVMNQAGKHLKETDFYVYEDIPKLLYDLRKGQMRKLQKAREKGFNAYFSKAQPDKLYVNGKQYVLPNSRFHQIFPLNKSSSREPQWRKIVYILHVDKLASVLLTSLGPAFQAFSSGGLCNSNLNKLPAFDSRL